MKMQKEMVESFLIAHRTFMENLSESMAILEHDIDEAKDVDSICTGEWCTAVESSLDELSKYIYSISEPRWLADKDSHKLSEMRHRIHDIYAKYRGVRSRSATH
ncbi:MAG: hypothetical protein ACD_75C00565G0005 [uncultured bacterium]|nr:MAG: hypothetical protein ACD_75C00565G0005 [uncultured bacterium]HBG21528.1 hypothetical protein [Desulfobulbaceae bacterium]